MKELFDAVLAAPDDDAPRLVYADALTESGDPRGEFISLQCRLAAGHLAPKAAAAAKKREQELFRAHVREWFDPFETWLRNGHRRSANPYALGGIEVRRGFVAACHYFTADERTLAELFARAPLLQALEVSGPWEPPVSQLAQLRTLKATGMICEMILEQIGAGRLDGLRELSLMVPEPRRFDLTRLERLKALAVLSVGDVRVPQKLERLTLAPGAKLQGAQPLFRSLSFPRRILADGDVALLVQQAPSLEVLELEQAQISAPHLKALASMRWPSLESLDLSSVPLGVEGAQALATLDAPKLRTLVLHNTRIRDEGANAIFASSLMKHVEWLNVRANRLTDQAFSSMTSRKDLVLRELNARKNPIGPKGLKAIQKACPGVRLLPG